MPQQGNYDSVFWGEYWREYRQHAERMAYNRTRTWPTIRMDDTPINSSQLNEIAVERLRHALRSEWPWARPVVFPDSVFAQSSISFAIAHNELDEDMSENSEELDNFLKEFALKEVC